MMTRKNYDESIKRLGAKETKHNNNAASSRDTALASGVLASFATGMAIFNSIQREAVIATIEGLIAAFGTYGAAHNLSNARTSSNLAAVEYAAQLNLQNLAVAQGNADFLTEPATLPRPLPSPVGPPTHPELL